jgi:hypothetical protein
MGCEEKRIILSLSFLFSSFFFIFLTKYFFWQDSFELSLFILWIFSFIFLFLSFSLLALGVPLNIFLLMIFLSTLSFFFFTKMNVLGALFAISSFLFTLWSYFSFQKAKDLFLKIDFFEILKKGTPPFLLSLALISSLFFFLSPNIFGGKFTLSKKLYNLLFGLITKPLSNFIGGDFSKMTVDEFLENAIKNYSKESLIFPLIKGAILEEEREKLSEVFGVKLQGNEELKEVIYWFLQKKISETSTTFQKFGTIGILLFLFLVFRTIFAFLSFFALPIIVIFFIILKKISFFEVVKTQREGEKLTL